MGPMSNPECINALNFQPIVLIPKLKDWMPEPINLCKSEPIDINDISTILKENNNIENATEMMKKKIEGIESEQNENSSPNIKSETTEDLTYKYPETFLNNSALSHIDFQDEKNRKCPICGRILGSIRSLRRHIEVHTQIKSYFCNECDASFLRSDYLKRHQRVHKKEETFICHHCQITFSLKCNLYKHIKRIHFGNLPFACTLCKKSFLKKENLKQHRQTHNIEKPFKCDYCYASFSDKSTLKTHITIHMGQRPFVCDTCGAAFRIKKILTRHEFKHAGEKPYICTDCQTVFTRAYNLKNHLKKKYHCVICNGTFNCKNGLQLHLYSHMPFSVECKKLRKVYGDRLLNQLMNTKKELM